MDKVVVTVPKNRVKQGDNFTVNAFFQDDVSGEPETPTNIYWRIDCLTTGTIVQDYVAVPGTLDSSLSLAIASDYCRLIDSRNQTEVKQITVIGDKGLTYQRSGQGRWTVYSLNAGL